jgi:hypothetical protein
MRSMKWEIVGAGCRDGSYLSKGFTLLEGAIIICSFLHPFYFIVVPYNCSVVGIYFSGLAISVSK